VSPCGPTPVVAPPPSLCGLPCLHMALCLWCFRLPVEVGSYVASLPRTHGGPDPARSRGGVLFTTWCRAHGGSTSLPRRAPEPPCGTIPVVAHPGLCTMHVLTPRALTQQSRRATLMPLVGGCPTPPNGVTDKLVCP
jgi:hypothetical protein